MEIIKSEIKYLDNYDIKEDKFLEYRTRNMDKYRDLFLYKNMKLLFYPNDKYKNISKYYRSMIDYLIIKNYDIEKNHKYLIIYNLSADIKANYFSDINYIKNNKKEIYSYIDVNNTKADLIITDILRYDVNIELNKEYNKKIYINFNNNFNKYANQLMIILDNLEKGGTLILFFRLLNNKLEYDLLQVLISCFDKVIFDNIYKSFMIICY